MTEQEEFEFRLRLERESAAEPTLPQQIKQQAANFVGGAVRGAGSIGATILYPVDKITDLVMGDRGPSLSGLITGKDPESRNQERRRKIDEGLTSLIGSDPNSLAYKAGKLGGEIAGTAGAGGAVANAVGRVAPGVAAAAPNLMQAIRTAGMTGGAMPTRMAGGAVAGAASAGLVNPEDAAAGGVVGGLLPPAIRGVGAVGRAIGFAGKGAGANPQVIQAARDAQQAGYVIPPSDIQPQGMLMEALGGLSGKIKTAQVASARNQEVTDALARKAIGLPADAQLDRNVLASIRQQAGQAYNAVAQAGTITPTPAYENALNQIIAPFKTAASGFPNARQNPVIAEIESLRSPQFDASAAVEKVKELRGLADDAYGRGDKTVGKALKQAATAIEDTIDTHLQGLGQPAADILKSFRDARKLIAKTYSVEGAVNGQTGQVSANALAAALKRGKPLSGELEAIAKTGEAFPKATQALKEAPKAVSPLDWATALIAGGGGSNPLGLTMLGARPAVRNMLLSPQVQRYAANPPSNAIAALSSASPEYLYRTAPVLFSDR